MVIRGKTRGNGKQLANYLLTQGENEAVTVLGIRGTSQPNDLNKSLLEMSLTSELTKSDKGLYHSQINPAYGEDKKMQADDWFKAADILEKELGLENQKRAIVLHEKKGRVHAHVVWERYDHEKGVMISDSFSRLAQDRARKAMELEFQQKATPKRNANKAQIKEELTELWQNTKDGKEFINAAQFKGYYVGVGRERPYVVFDETGRSFDLVRQVKGVKTKDVKQRFQGIDLTPEKKIIATLAKKKSDESLIKSQETMLDMKAAFKNRGEVETEEKEKQKDKMKLMLDNSDMTQRSKKQEIEEEFLRRLEEKKKKRERGMERD